MSESPVERRIRETLEQTKTPAQRATVERLHAEGKTAWVEKRTGKGVIAEATRYFKTGDVEKLGVGLYNFSIYVLGEIAHFNLEGFRHVYRDVRDYLRFLGHEARRVAQVSGHSEHVYTDGLTGSEVFHAILTVADAERERIFAEGAEADRSAAFAQATRLAESLGMELVAK